METYYLYVKTHNVTGLKYLGQTIQNPFIYKGSGERWLPHIKKHGYNVTTEIVGVYNTKEDLREGGLYYSEMWNIVEDKQWANLKPEEGDGGSNPATEERKRKIGLANKGRKRFDMIGNNWASGPRKYKRTKEHQMKLWESRRRNMVI